MSNEDIRRRRDRLKSTVHSFWGRRWFPTLRERVEKVHSLRAFIAQPDHELRWRLVGWIKTAGDADLLRLERALGLREPQTGSGPSRRPPPSRVASFREDFESLRGVPSREDRQARRDSAERAAQSRLRKEQAKAKEKRKRPVDEYNLYVARTTGTQSFAPPLREDQPPIAELVERYNNGSAAERRRASENIGEIMAHQLMTERYGDQIKLLTEPEPHPDNNPTGAHSLDLVYQNNAPPPDFFVIEAKGGSGSHKGSFRKEAGDTKGIKQDHLAEQGSHRYLQDVIGAMANSSDQNKKEIGAQLQNSLMAGGSVEYVQIGQPYQCSDGQIDSFKDTQVTRFMV